MYQGLMFGTQIMKNIKPLKRIYYYHIIVPSFLKAKYSIKVLFYFFGGEIQVKSKHFGCDLLAKLLGTLPSISTNTKCHLFTG